MIFMFRPVKLEDLVQGLEILLRVRLDLLKTVKDTLHSQDRRDKFRATRQDKK